MSQISIWPLRKHDLVLGGKTLVGNHRGQTFLVVGHQVCTHLLSKSLSFRGWRLSGFNALALTVHVPVHRPFEAVQLSCPLSRKTPPKHNVSTSMFDGEDGVLGVIGSIPPPNTASWVDAKELDFGLIWPQHFHPGLLWIIGKLQTGLNVLSWAGGPCRRCRIAVLHGVVCYQLFSWWLWSQLPWDHWQDPAV